MTDVFIAIVAEMTLGRDINTFVVKITTSGKPVMHEKPEESFGSTRGMVFPHKLEVLVLSGNKIGISETRAYAPGGETVLLVR